MNPGITTGTRPRYGALELKQTYQQGLGFALLIAVALHLAAVEGSQIYERLTRSGAPALLIPTVPVRIRPIDLAPPVRLLPEQPLGLEPLKAKKNFVVGIPIPAPSEDVTSPDVMATQTQIRDFLDGLFEPGGQGVDTQGRIGLSQIPDVLITLPKPGDYVFVTREAQVLPNQAKPTYPTFAELAGLEGRVALRVLVGPEGNVLDVLVVNPTDDEAGFEEAAVKAAWTWKYAPALQNDRPVAVWVNVPVYFRLP